MFKNKLSKAQIQKLYLIWPSILVLLGLFVYPLGTILLQSLFPKLLDSGFREISFYSFFQTFGDSYTYRSILDALWFGGATAFLTAVLGTLFAVMVHRKKVRGEKAVNLLIWLIFFTPSYLIAEGWVLVMQRHGLLNVTFSIPDGKLDWFFTPWGIIAAMALRLFPVVYLSVLNGLRGLGPEYEEAARTLGARSFRVWVKIGVPLLFPSILAGATLAFAESASDFGFASALVPQAHIPMLTYSIYTALNQMPVNYSQVGVLSLVLIAIIALAMWSQKFILGRGSFSIIQNQIRHFRVHHSRSAFWTFIAYLIIVIAYVIPMGGEFVSSILDNTNDGITASNITITHYLTALHQGSDSLQAIGRSLVLSSGTAIVAAFLGIGLAFVIFRGSGLSTKLLYVLTMSTLAIPGIVLAAGYVFAFNAPFLIPFHLNFYGTLFCVYLAYLAGSLPNSIRLQIAAITQISPSLLNAGQVHGANIFKVFTKILLPLVAGTLISTLYLIFSHLMFELPASQLLYPPSESLLPVVITKYYNELKVEDGAALTVLSIGLVLAVFGIGQFMIYSVRRAIRWNKDRTIKQLTHGIQPTTELKLSLAETVQKIDLEG